MSLTFAVALAALVCGCSRRPREWSDEEVMAFLQGADSVELVFLLKDIVRQDGRAAPFSGLSDTTDPGSMVSLVTLEPKGKCKCAHGHAIVFRRGDEAVSVAICSHCFDVILPGGTRHYRMPEALWRRFCEEARRYLEDAKDLDEQDRKATKHLTSLGE